MQSIAARVPLPVWITVLALLTAVAPLATDMYLPALPGLAADLGTTASAAQLTLTAFLVGLALGQLVIGPLSDARGRRGLLLAGAALCVVASVICLVAPSVVVLVVGRFLQGFGGAAGVVLARAVIVDRTEGARTAQLFSVMMAINGIAPVVAPLLGSALPGWRAVFGVLLVLSVLMLAGAFLAVPETLPADRRVRSGLRATVRDVGSLLRRPRYVGYTLAFALSFATMFAYISGSPFVLQETLGLSASAYALAFGVNAAGIVTGSLVSGRLAGRWAPPSQFRTAVTGLAVLSLAYLAVVLAGAPRWPVLVVLFLALGTLGFVLGNGAALAAGEARDLAGTGSALMGALQFGLGAVVSPLVGSSPLAMAAAMVIASALALTMVSTLARAAAPVPVT